MPYPARSGQRQSAIHIQHSAQRHRPRSVDRQVRKRGAHRVEGLRLEAIGGSVEGGSEIIVSVENPIPLVDILKGMPSVAEAVKQGKDTRVVLKTE